MHAADRCLWSLAINIGGYHVEVSLSFKFWHLVNAHYIFERCSHARMHVWVAEWLEWTQLRADVAGSNPSKLKVWTCMLYTNGTGRFACYLARGRVGRVLDVKNRRRGFESARFGGKLKYARSDDHILGRTILRVQALSRCRQICFAS